MFGYRIDELVGRSIDILVPEHHHASHSRHIAAFAASSEPARPMVGRPWVEARRRNGELFPASISILRLEHGGHLLLGALVRDMSEAAAQLARERQLRRDADAAQRAKATFLAHLSHELRMPLNAVIGFAEAMEGGHAGNDPACYRQYARDIAGSGRHLLGQLEELLAAAQDSGSVSG